MGSFHVSCGLSHTSIFPSERMGLIPLVSTDESYTNKDKEKKGNITLAPQTHMISNDGSFVLYKLAAFPIWGEYNDYGELENIERDDNVLALEEFFGTDIEAIMTVIARGVRDLSKKQLEAFDKDKLKHLQTWSGMFVNRDVYDAMADTFQRKHDTNAFTDADLTCRWLEEMGFTFVEDLNKELDDALINSVVEDAIAAAKERGETTVDVKTLDVNKLAGEITEKKKKDERERYNLIYKHPSSDKYFMASDGQFSHVVEKKEKGYEEVRSTKFDCFVYNPFNLDKLWTRLTGVSLDVDRFKEMNKYRFEFDTLREMVKKNTIMEQDRKLAGAVDKNKFWTDMLYYGMGREFYGEAFWRLYKDFLGDKRNWLDDMNEKFKSVYWMMYCTNRVFMPIFSGPQCGELKVEIEMCDIVKTIVKAKRKKWGAQDEE